MNSSNGRDAKGRFAHGNKFSKGRPTREIEADNFRALYQACPPERLMGIIDALCKKAETGNLEAVRILLRHILPATTMHAEVGEVEEYRVAGRSPAQTNALMSRMLRQKIEERRKYEAGLRDKGIDLRQNMD